MPFILSLLLSTLTARWLQTTKTVVADSVIRTFPDPLSSQIQAQAGVPMSNAARPAWLTILCPITAAFSLFPDSGPMVTMKRNRVSLSHGMRAAAGMFSEHIFTHSTYPCVNTNVTQPGRIKLFAQLVCDKEWIFKVSILRPGRS